MERQLEAEKKADVNGTADNNLAPLRGKNFLRKGQGIARYTTGFKTDQKLKKQSLKGKSIVSLPMTSLKLNMKPKRENENEEKMVASIVNQVCFLKLYYVSVPFIQCGKYISFLNYDPDFIW